MATNERNMALKGHLKDKSSVLTPMRKSRDEATRLSVELNKRMGRTKRDANKLQQSEPLNWVPAKNPKPRAVPATMGFLKE